MSDNIATITDVTATAPERTPLQTKDFLQGIIDDCIGPDDDILDLDRDDVFRIFGERFAKACVEHAAELSRHEMLRCYRMGCNQVIRMHNVMAKGRADNSQGVLYADHKLYIPKSYGITCAAWAGRVEFGLAKVTGDEFMIVNNALHRYHKDDGFCHLLDKNELDMMMLAWDDDWDVGAAGPRFTRAIYQEAYCDCLRRGLDPEGGDDMGPDETPFVNGIFNYRTKTMSKAGPERRLITCLPIEMPTEPDGVHVAKQLPQPHAEARGDKGGLRDLTPMGWLHDVSGGDQKFETGWWKCTAFVLRPYKNFRKAFLFASPKDSCGVGSGGKGTSIGIYHNMLGEENVSTMGIDKFDKDFASSEIYGKLAVLPDDTSAKALIRDSGTVKSLISQDPINARAPYGNWFHFKPHAHVVVSMNEPMASVDHTDAFWNRFAVLPFPRTFDNRGTERFSSIKEILSSDKRFAQWFAWYALTQFPDFEELDSDEYLNQNLQDMRAESDTTQRLCNAVFDVMDDMGIKAINSETFFYILRDYAHSTEPQAMVPGHTKPDFRNAFARAAVDHGFCLPRDRQGKSARLSPGTFVSSTEIARLVRRLTPNLRDGAFAGCGRTSRLIVTDSMRSWEMERSRGWAVKKSIWEAYAGVPVAPDDPDDGPDGPDGGPGGGTTSVPGGTSGTPYVRFTPGPAIPAAAPDAVSGSGQHADHAASDEAADVAAAPASGPIARPFGAGAPAVTAARADAMTGADAPADAMTGATPSADAPADAADASSQPRAAGAGAQYDVVVPRQSLVDYVLSLEGDPDIEDSLISARNEAFDELEATQSVMNSQFTARMCRSMISSYMCEGPSVKTAGRLLGARIWLSANPEAAIATVDPRELAFLGLEARGGRLVDPRNPDPDWQWE